MTPWCRQQIPVEGNFGQLFDQLNLSVDLLSREFSTNLILEEEQQQSVLEGVLLDGEFTQAVRDSAQKLRTLVEKLLNILELLLSLTFIGIFTQSFGYLRQYRTDVRFDNVYLTARFRQIDARRKKAGRCGLLPLRRSEKKKIIDLQSLKIHTAELHQVVNINVGGDSMMARLLRKTVSAFNSSSSITINTDNLECVSPPSSLSAGVYVKCVCCVLMAVLFSCLQVYTNRLRRVIAAFYFPEREKKRIVFLYNLMMQSRKPCTDRERVISRGRRIRTVFQQLSRWWHHLSGHQKQEVELEETWYDPG
ncbi:hypothetical protein fugu_009499 [Takifugu bimaculatus]|uniref:Dendritic cell-specific transmembrane protein-like domain-containing protein n=1 Tax=Takifugu bimaculatus TaxID=433685 RepID=A0A4Z2CCP2_9TELE|nr:hypothetical protein fugu_009499 [Takifugu bimaculatus]